MESKSNGLIYIKGSFFLNHLVPQLQQVKMCPRETFTETSWFREAATMAVIGTPH